MRSRRHMCVVTRTTSRTNHTAAIIWQVDMASLFCYNISVVWEMTERSVEYRNQCFGAKCFIHLQGICHLKVSLMLFFILLLNLKFRSSASTNSLSVHLCFVFTLYFFPACIIYVGPPKNSFCIFSLFVPSLYMFIIPWYLLATAFIHSKYRVFLYVILY
jgi:hypothetical protein